MLNIDLNVIPYLLDLYYYNSCSPPRVRWRCEEEGEEEAKRKKKKEKSKKKKEGSSDGD